MNSIENVPVLVSKLPIWKQEIGPLRKSKEGGSNLVAHQSVEILLQLVDVRGEEVSCEDVNASFFAEVSKFEADLRLFIVYWWWLDLHYFLWLH